MAKRAVTYSKALADEICSLMADEGIPLKQICEREDMPTMSTVRRWAEDDVHGFRAQYLVADSLKYQTMEDECLQIADDSRNDYIDREDKNGDLQTVLNPEHISRSKLRIDTRKDFMKVRRPDLYGQKHTVEHTGKNGGPVQHQIENMSNLDLGRRILFLIDSAKENVEEGQLVGDAAEVTPSAELPAPPERTEA